MRAPVYGPVTGGSPGVIGSRAGARWRILHFSTEVWLRAVALPPVERSCADLILARRQTQAPTVLASSLWSGNRRRQEIHSHEIYSKRRLPMPCGRIIYEAFNIGDKHNFPPDSLCRGPSNLRTPPPSISDEHSLGIGPSLSIGRARCRCRRLLMNDVLARAGKQRATGVRLLQAGFHNRSLCCIELGSDPEPIPSSPRGNNLPAKRGCRGL